MSMDWKIRQAVDLSKGFPEVVVWPKALIMYGDNSAHVWELEVLDAGQPVDLAGYSVKGYFLRDDGNTVLVTGSATGNVASVVLDSTCYAIEGSLRGIIRISKVGQVLTASEVFFTVRSSIGDSIVDPGGLIPSLDDLLAQIDAMEQATGDAIEAAQDALNGIITSVTISGHNLTFTTVGGTTYTIVDAMKGVHDATGAANDAAGTANTAAENADNARTSLITEVGAAIGGIPAEVTDQINTRLGGLSFSVDPADAGLNITYTY